MHLKEVLENINNYNLKGDVLPFITGLSSDSRKVAPGHLFFSFTEDKNLRDNHIKEAIANGACAIVTKNYDSELPVSQIICADVKALAGKISSHYYAYPSQNLFLVGITGTNGKTTTSFMTHYLLQKLVGKSGLIGTIEYRLGQEILPAKHTTPDVIDNHFLLHKMKEQGCTCAVMEVSSHALCQKRVESLDFDVAIFTNLTPEHLDYHRSMQAYSAAKNLLFQHLPSQKMAIVNQDSSWTSSVLQNCRAAVFSYGIKQKADLTAQDICFTDKGTKMTLCYQKEKISSFLPLVGEFNVYNCLAGISTLLVKGFSLEEVSPLLTNIPSVAGRLQAVPNHLGLFIYIDFAHTPAALENVLKTLKTCHPCAKILTLFGCGGDRDQLKRPLMAKVVESLSDFCVVTSDNPRTENPVKICQDILVGFSQAACYTVELDRVKAIEQIIQQANKGDVVVIAGKGHENYQIIGTQLLDFDDYQMTKNICNTFLNKKN